MIGCLRTRVRKQPIIALYFDSELVLKFYNLEARVHSVCFTFRVCLKAYMTRTKLRGAGSYNRDYYFFIKLNHYKFNTKLEYDLPIYTEILVYREMLV